MTTTPMSATRKECWLNTATPANTPANKMKSTGTGPIIGLAA